MKFVIRSAAALVAVTNLSQFALAANSPPLVTTQPDPHADVAPYFVTDSDPRWSSADWSADDIEALRSKIKYVFVIFNENRSFDHEYGTFPGANGLYSDGKAPRPPADTPGFAQTYLDAVTGQTVTVQPFLVGPAQNASFKDSTDHSHKGLAAKLDVQGGVRENGQVRRSRVAPICAAPAATKARSRGPSSPVSSWRIWTATPSRSSGATPSRFTLFDNIFATEDTPSTPNAIAMISGQSGETQWVKHPSSPYNPTETGHVGVISGSINGKTYAGVATTEGPPLVNDPQPWWGSEFDDTATSVREPTAAG